MTSDAYIFDQDVILARRARMAGTASEHDFLLRRVGEDFLERLAVVQREFPLAINFGAYHGFLSGLIASAPSVGQVVSFEGCAALQKLCPGDSVLADLEAIPVSAQSIDLAISGLALHFVNDLPGTLLQIRHALKPDGFFLGAILGGESLKELREAWSIAEEEVLGGVSPRVAPFVDLRDFGSLLQRAGFALPVVDTDIVKVRYPSALALMRDIKKMGASNPLVARHRKPVTKTLLARAAMIYEERFAEEDGRVPATFEIVTASAWAPHESQQKPLRPGSAKMRLADALGVEEKSAGEKAGE